MSMYILCLFAAILDSSHISTISSHISNFLSHNSIRQAPAYLQSQKLNYHDSHPLMRRKIQMFTNRRNFIKGALVAGSALNLGFKTNFEDKKEVKPVEKAAKPLRI